MSGVRKPPPEPSVPSENLTGEVGGINCGGDMGVRRCLARFLTSLALLHTPKSANGPRSNSFRPDSPFTTTSHGDGRLSQPPSSHRTWSVPDASTKPQLNLYFLSVSEYNTNHRSHTSPAILPKGVYQNDYNRKKSRFAGYISA